MEHDFLDKYSNLNSIIHRIDARIKILVFISFILLVILTPAGEFTKFLLYFLAVLSVILASGVPPGFVFRRSLVVFPFVILIGLLNLLMIEDYGMVLWNVSVKSWLSVLASIALVSTTPFPRLMKGLQGLRFPRIMIMIISFMYRYIFITTDEVMRIRRCLESRNFQGSRIDYLKLFGNIVGSLFIRSYERGERVYQAMLARGFTGEIRTMNGVRKND